MGIGWKLNILTYSDQSRKGEGRTINSLDSDRNTEMHEMVMATKFSEEDENWL